MGSKDKGKRETKKAPKPKPKVEPGRKRGEDTRLGGPPKSWPRANGLLKSVFTKGTASTVPHWALATEGFTVCVTSYLRAVPLVPSPRTGAPYLAGFSRDVGYQRCWSL